MNILLLTPYLDQKKGPIVWAKTFAQKISKENVNLFVLTFNENISNDYDLCRFTHYGYKIEEKILKYPFLSIIHKVIFLEKKHNINVVHTNDPLLGFASVVAKKFTGVPVVLRMGGKYFDELHEQCKRHCTNIFGTYSKFPVKVAAYLLQNMGIYTMKNVDVLVAVNDYMCQYLKFYGLSSYIVPNAVDAKNYSLAYLEKGAFLQKETLLQNGSLLAISNMSVFNKVEGIKNLLHSLYFLKGDFPNIHLYIVGDGPYRRYLESYVSSLDLSKNVTFLGYRNDIPMLLNECSIYIHSSLQDVFPNVILEAMASKKPIVATKVGGIPELIIDKYNGLLCNCTPEEISYSIKLLLNNEDLREYIANNAYSSVFEKYNWNQVVNSYISIYKKILQDY